MKINLLYKGLCTNDIHEHEIDIVNSDSLHSLKHAFETNYPRVSQYPNDVDIFRFCNGSAVPNEYIFKWKLFEKNKITEIAQLVAIDELGDKT